MTPEPCKAFGVLVNGPFVKFCPKLFKGPIVEWGFYVKPLGIKQVFKVVQHVPVLVAMVTEPTFCRVADGVVP